MITEPVSNLEQFGLYFGNKVADLGIGSGAWTLEISKLVGPNGRVLAVDVQKELIENIKVLIKRDGIDNVIPMLADMEKFGGIKIKDEVLDAAVVSNVLFLVQDKENFLREVGRILKKGGRALVIDWMDSFAGMGPHFDQVVRQEEAENLFKGHGFDIEKHIDAGDHHYGFVAVKQK